MTNFVIGLTFLALFSITWSAIFGIVTELPYGMEPAVQAFSNAMYSAQLILPLLSTPFELVLAAIEVKMAIIMFFVALWFVRLVRG